MNATAPMIAFEPDLLFSSKIEGAAAKNGIEVRVVSNSEELFRILKETTPRVLLVNLDSLEGNLAPLGELARKKSCELVGYYSHVNTRVAGQAKNVGFDRVVSRGAFVMGLNEMLEEYLRKT